MLAVINTDAGDKCRSEHLETDNLQSKMLFLTRFPLAPVWCGISSTDWDRKRMDHHHPKTGVVQTWGELIVNANALIMHSYFPVIQGND